jgi:acetyl esterase/lipase
VGIVSGLKVSRDGRRIGFTLSRADAPSDAYTYELAEKKLVRWTYSETGGLDASTFVVPQRISYKSFDQREIPAYVYKPRGAKKAPVVISIHGGPEGQYQPFFTPLTQYWVTELGLAVIAPNVRGSTGYGKTYVALDNAEKREDSVKDIGALLDWIATQPDLDASRVAVFGGSYGGYMVLASPRPLRRPDQGGRRRRRHRELHHLPREDQRLPRRPPPRRVRRRARPQDARRCSSGSPPPITPRRSRSALLVAHGRNDPRVPFFEAEQIASKVRGPGPPGVDGVRGQRGAWLREKENRDYLSAAMTLFFKRTLLD